MHTFQGATGTKGTLTSFRSYSGYKQEATEGPRRLMGVSEQVRDEQESPLLHFGTLIMARVQRGMIVCTLSHMTLYLASTILSESWSN